MATHSSILPCKTPRTEEPGRLQFLRQQRVGHERKLWDRRIICIFLTFRLRLTHWNQHFIDMRKNHEKLLMLLTLFLCCNWDSQYSHNSQNYSQLHQPMTHFFFVLFFFSLCIFSLLLPFIFLISYCSLTLLLDDSRFALVTALPTLSPLLPTRDTAQVQPHLSQCASLRMQQYTAVSLRVTWGRTKVLDFLSEAMVREAMLLFTVPRKP